MYFVLGYKLFTLGHITNMSSIILKWYKIFPLADKDLVLQKDSI